MKNIKKLMELTNYPHGYKDDFPDPDVDINQMISNYISNVITLKIYSLEKTIKNTEYSLQLYKDNEKRVKWLKELLTDRTKELNILIQKSQKIQDTIHNVLYDELEKLEQKVPVNDM